MEGTWSLWAAIAATVMAIVVTVGCGGSGGEAGSDAGRASAPAAQDDDPTVGGGDRAQIAEVVDDVQDSLIAGDGGLCFELSSAQVRQLARWAGQKGDDCYAAVADAIRRRRALGIASVRSRVLSVEVSGGYGKPLRATAVVADPAGESYQSRFVNRGGGWKIARLLPATSSGLGGPVAGAPPDSLLLVRGVHALAPRADGPLYEVRTSGKRVRVGRLSCKRFDVSGSGRGLCLAVTEEGAGYEGIVFDERYRPVRRFEAVGVPDRVRVSADGRYGAYTSFDPAGSEGYFTSTGKFSTYTRIVDLRTGRELLRLEDLEVTRRGRRVATADAELWGVTFDRGGRFYATFAPPGHHYLIAGHVGSSRARVLRDGVECPALAPDGRRIAYKRRLGDRNAWRFHVLDLRSGRDVPLAERRSIDDQPAWLDDERVLYSDDLATFAVPADGSGVPVRLARRATSPTSVVP